ncbi:MAG: cytochrome c [Leptospiraceae bacterium]|nr:cytochrome c [Leptospiraceae bacterium]
MKHKFLTLIIILSFALVLNCKENDSGQEEGAPVDPLKEKGIGPVKEVKLGAIESSMVERGKATFELKCTACHKFDEKVVGPALKDVTRRRTPEWIMNMMLNPIEMTKQDKIAQELLATHLTQMTPQNLSESDARDILEYLRKMDGN